MKKYFSTLLTVSALATTFATAPASATPRFWVVNRSYSEIVRVYVQYPDGYLANDLLGGNGTIPSDDRVRVLRSSFPGCVVTIVVVNDNEDTAYFPNFNTCKGPLYVSNKAFQ